MPTSAFFQLQNTIVSVVAVVAVAAIAVVAVVAVIVGVDTVLMLEKQTATTEKRKTKKAWPE